MSKAKIISVLLLVLISTKIIAQDKASIVGEVTESTGKTALEFATVAITNFSDSSLIAYTVSNHSGMFHLRNLPINQKIVIHISFASYQSFKLDTSLQVGQSDLGTISLIPKTLAGVTIKGERIPVFIKKDTIEFRADAFKTRPNAVVEDLLRKLPGIQVNADGSIMMEGKSISKVLIDGKRFFGDDPKFATRNLNAEFIEKIQIYDDRENDPDHLIGDSQVKKIINLKFKKIYKKSSFGKIYGGAGTSKTYESGALLNSFRDTLQISLLGLSNNLSKTGFSDDDLYNNGGFNRGGADGLYNGNLALGGNNFNSIQNVLTTGLNINDDYGQKLKLNLNYFYSVVKDLFKTQQVEQTLLGDTTIVIKGNSTRDKAKFQHNINALIEWNPSGNVQIRYAPDFKYTILHNTDSLFEHRSNNFNANVSDLNSHNNDDSYQIQFNHSLFYYQAIGDRGKSLTISHNLSIGSDNRNQFNNSMLLSLVATLPSDSLHELLKNNNINNSADLGITYRYPFSKSFATDLNYKASYNYISQSISTYNQNPATGQFELFVPSESNDLSQKQFSNKFNIQVEYLLNPKITIVSGINLQAENIDNAFSEKSHSLYQNYCYALPYFNIRGRSFHLSYNPTLVLPNASDLQPITIQYNPLFSFTGNAKLTPGINHNISFDFNKYFTDKQLSISAYSNLTLSNNPVVRQTDTYSNGQIQAYSVNAPGLNNYHWYSSFSISKAFKTTGLWQFQLSEALNNSIDKELFIVNGQRGVQYTSGLGFRNQFVASFNNLIDINSQLNIKFSNNFYVNAPYQTRNFIMPSAINKFTFYYPSNLIFEVIYNYYFNSQLSEGFQHSINLLNASLARGFLKKKNGEVKLSVFDLLNSNVNVTRFVYQNNIFDTQNAIQKRYFLITLLYKFTNTVK